VTEATLAESPDGVEMIGIEDVFGLEFEVAFKHDGEVLVLMI
jgi:hypothetical protein